MKDFIGETIFALAVVMVIAVISIPTAMYNHGRNRLIAETIQAGGDPMGVACAMDNLYSEACRDIIAK